MGEKKCSVFKHFSDIHPKIFGGKRCILLLGVPVLAGTSFHSLHPIHSQMSHMEFL